MHFLLLYSLFHWGTNNSEKVLVTQLCPTPLPLEELWPTRFLCPWDSPGKNTWVVCHSFLQGIFLTQGSNPGLLQLLHCRQVLYKLSQQGSPTTLSTPHKLTVAPFVTVGFHASFLFIIVSFVESCNSVKSGHQYYIHLHILYMSICLDCILY